MKIEEIQNLIKLVSRQDLTEVKIEQKDFKITIKNEKYKAFTSSTQSNVLPTISLPQMPSFQMPQNDNNPVNNDSFISENNNVKVEVKNRKVIKSPMIGTFYTSSNPENPPFVKVGDTISKGQVLCIIEAMKLFNEILSEEDGKIVEILVDNSSPVVYDQELFVIE